MEPLEHELKQLIIDALDLEDVTPEEIDRDAPLFVDGLGLDSIDALELAMVIHKRYGVRLEAEDEANKEIFRSLATLAAHVGAHRNGGAGGEA